LFKGRPYPSAKGKHFLALRDPNCVWFTVTSADEKHATVKTKHREAGLLEYTYTIERAQRAGYLTGGNKHNWQTMPQEMLEARAKSKGADRWYPGSTFGMPTVEEIQDGEESEDE
jgi:RecT family